MKKIITLLLLISLSACVSGLSDSESRKYATYKQKGYNLETKNKYVGLGLGILPGGGSFYVGQVGMGIAGIILYPFSILWDPINGYNGSQSINYNATNDFVNMKKETEIRDLTMKFEVGNISQKKYIIMKQKVEDKYSANF